MRSYIIKRLLLCIPTLFGITLVTFMIIQLAPGSPVELRLRQLGGAGMGEEVTAELIEQTKKLYGLDKPVLFNAAAFRERGVCGLFDARYWIWLRKIALLDFGNSYKDNRRVSDKILERVPVTLQLSIISIFLVYLISIPLGVYSSVRHESRPEKLLTLFLFVLYSLPSFWVATMLIIFLGGGEYLDLFPIYGLSSEGAEALGFRQWLLDRIWHLVLPVGCLAYGSLAVISRYCRVGMLETLRQDYIRTARAKGLSEKSVVFKHALRNSLIPIVTLLGMLLPALLGGAIIIESIFSIPGMGQLAFEAILSRDYPVVMGIATISAILTLLGMLLADILYSIVDPRISYK